MRYVARDADTYQRIAALLYGKWEIYPLIAETNAYREVVPGTVLEIPVPRTSSAIHTCADGEKSGYPILSKKFYGVESFAEFLRYHNPTVICRAGNRIAIPALVTQEQYSAAQALYAQMNSRGGLL